MPRLTIFIVVVLVFDANINIARTLFSNLKIDDKNKLTYLLNPELDGLIKIGKIDFGERYLNLYEPLCKTIDYIILNPAWHPTYILVESSIINKPSDFSY